MDEVGGGVAQTSQHNLDSLALLSISASPVDQRLERLERRRGLRGAQPAVEHLLTDADHRSLSVEGQTIALLGTAPDSIDSVIVYEGE